MLLNNEWKLSVEMTCAGCGSDIYERNIIQTTSKYVIILFKVFKYDPMTKTSRKLDNLKIKNVSTQRFKIGPNNREYRTFGGIFHMGSTVEAGHYTAHVKCDEKWYETNDRHISNKNWPENSNVPSRRCLYMLFLEDVAETNLSGTDLSVDNSSDEQLLNKYSSDEDDSGDSFTPVIAVSHTYSYLPKVFASDSGLECYAASVLQILLNKKMLQNELLKYQNESIRALVESYTNNSITILSCTPIRKFLGGDFSLCKQQYAEHFFLKLIEMMNIGKQIPTILANSFEMLCTTEMSCLESHCSNPYYFCETYTVYTLHVDISTILENNLQSALDMFSSIEWKLSGEKTCNGCGKYIYERIIIKTTSKYMAIVLKVFEHQNTNTSQKSKDIKIENVSTQPFQICYQDFRTFGGIFHFGNNMKSGYYQSYVKHENQWYGICDTFVSQENWPEHSIINGIEGDNGCLYMLFLEEVEEDNEDEEDEEES